MEEAALICRHATASSLVILDEVGRGTSTYDGFAIACAIIEYVHQAVQARCLFATHYHELYDMFEQTPGISFYHAASKQTDDGVLLLHKIIPGCAEGSFGLEVARIARLPDEVVARAHILLHQIETKQHAFTPSVHADTVYKTRYEELRKQQSELSDQVARLEEILGSLRSVDSNTLSPKAAFDLVWNLQERLQKTTGT